MAERPPIRMPQLPELASRAGLLPACYAVLADAAGLVSAGTRVQLENRVPRMLRRDRHLVQGSGAGDSLCPAPPRAVAAGQSDAAGLSGMARAAGLNKEGGSEITKIFARIAGVKFGKGD